MTYQKPRCDCGEELLYCVDEVSTNFYKITNKGEEGKRKYDSLPSTLAHGQRLYCGECQEYYEFDYDDQGRIIRIDVRF